MGNVIIGGGGTDTLVGGKRTVAGTAAQRGLGKVDPRLVAIIDAAAARSPYDVQIFSGKRSGPSAKSRHNTGNAVDIVLIDPNTGERIPNLRSAEAFPIYEEFAKTFREEQQSLYPELSDDVRWGGGFRQGVAFDLMHFDIKPGGQMAYWDWETGLNEAGKAALAKLGPGKIYADGQIQNAPAGKRYASLWGRGDLIEPPQTAQSAIASLLNPGGGTQVPEPPTAAMGFAPTIPDAGFGMPPPPTQVATAPPMSPPQPPPQWAQATGFPEVGGAGQDAMLGGPTPPLPRMRDQSILDQQRADQLDEALFGAGPHRGDFARGRPEGRWLEGAGGAPDAATVPTPGISPMRPAVGGPNDRRPQPPTPQTRPDNFVWHGGGAPDNPPNPPMRPGEQPPLTDEDRQRILSDLADFRERDQWSPTVAGMPDIPRPAFQSRIAGRPEFPGAIQPPRDETPNPPPPSEPRTPATTGLTPEMMDRLRQRQGIGPFAARPEFPGALPAAPNPYDDPSREFDVPGPFTLMADARPPAPAAPPPEAQAKDDAYTPAPLPPDFAITGPAPIITTTVPPSPDGPIGNVVAPYLDHGSGRRPFIDANRAPTPIDSNTGVYMTDDRAPPPAVNWNDQFNVSFSPGGPGMIADLTPPAVAPPQPQLGNPFDAIMGPGAAMGAMPFNDTAQGIGAPDFNVAAPPSSFDSAPTGDLGLGMPPKPALMSGASAFYRPDAPDPTFAGGSVVRPPTPAPGQPGVVSGEMPTPEGAMDIRSPVQGGPGLPPAPVVPAPSQAPRQTNPGAERQRSGIIGRVLGGLLGGPLGALGGGLLGGGGGGFGFGGQPSFAWSGGGNAAYGNGGTTTYQKGTSNALGGSNALSWKGSNGQTVTVVQDPWTGTYYGPTNTGTAAGGLY